MIPPPPTSTLFPYTTLFRSAERAGGVALGARQQEAATGDLAGSGDPDDLHDEQGGGGDRKSTRLNSSHITISYAVFCLKKKKIGKFCFAICTHKRYI